MKTRNHLIAVMLLLLAIVATGCHFPNNRVRTIRVTNDHSTLKIQYSGSIVFNDDQTAIEHLSPNGFVKYRRDDQLFTVKRDGSGVLIYQLNDGIRNLDYQDMDGKEFSAKVVKEIAAHY